MAPAEPQPASAGATRPTAHSAAAGPFVINLCSSTTPLALSQPQSPELKRFTFFMSRRREDGRERFRLHMGYFETLAEAEEWLAIVREIYPGAWAGEAPGKRLREREAAAAAATPAAQPAVASTAPAAPRSSPVPPVAAAPRAGSAPSPQAAAPRVIPTVHAAPTAAGQAGRASAAAFATSGRAAPAARPAAAAAAPAQARAAHRGLQPVTAPKSPPAPAARARQAPAAPASNVREVLASLDESSTTDRTREMPAVAPAARRPAQSAQDPLTDTQVLRILENRRADDGARSDGPDTGNISLLRPDDTGTRRALREAVRQNAPVSFAVQLLWSVQPIDLRTVPPLAIFSAYTLYTVEGSREGRKWYGLRLGFFSDAISAKQVAYYVRSEFASVAVVPVSPQERERATRGDAPPAAPPRVEKKTRIDLSEEFKLIDDDPPPPPPPPRAAAPKAPAPRPKRPTRGSNRVQARERRTPQTLEETLEILGADQLEIDDGRGDLLNDTGVRHLKVSVRKSTAFTRLLDRLAERVGKG